MVPLQTKTAFSLLQSPMMPAQLVKSAKAKGYTAVAITDNNVLYGMDNFYRAAKAADIKPILGLTATLHGLVTSQPYPIVFLVENQTGYHHLLAISSYIQTHDTTSFADIAQFLSGLYVILPAVGELSVVLGAEPERALTMIQTLITASTADHVFLGVTPTMRPELLTAMKQLADTTGARLLAMAEVTYADASDQFAAQVIQKLGQGEVITNVGQAQREPATAYLPTVSEWQASFETAGLAEAVANTDWIAEHSDFELVKSAVTLPAFTTPNGETSADYLRTLAQTGLKNRLHGLDVDASVYQQRLDEELAVIIDLGFADYFLIVWDVINFAHKQAIRTGPGRGSAAGSLVAYTLWITDVDPIAYDLLFERFLNPERAQMPDIDIDIPDNRREEVLAYLHEKYGHERVAQIITFSTMAQRAVIRDVARVFGLNPSQIDTLSKAMPRDAADLTAAYEQSQPFRNALIDVPVDGELLYETARKLEGLPRNSSLHAAGVVLSADPLVDTMPVQLGEDGRLVTQLPKGPVEALGLLKMDFLALSNLNILDIALREIQKQEDSANFNIATIDLNDDATLRLFRHGMTNGVFQFESAGMKNILRQLQPDRFEDIVAANALFRPGPMQNIPHFVARKHGQEAQDVPDQSMADILAPTYGIIVYQEQVMRVAEQFAGFSLGGADLLRRAMSKKDGAKIAAMKTDFVNGAVAKGHDSQVAEQVFGYIETFAQYGFNRSHAVAYSKLAFQLAYIKAHYPAAFYKAVLNDAIADKKKVSTYIAEAKASGVTLLGPSINHSWQGYSMNKAGALQMGLASISGMRRDFRESILRERQENGAFKDLGNLIGRLESKYRKAEQLEPLVYAGALDEFGYNRASILASLRGFIDAVGLAGESMSLFASLTPKVREVDELPSAEKLGYEREYLGVYLSGHPIEPYLNAIPENKRLDIASLAVGVNQATIIVYVENVKKIRTKKGDQMAFVDGMDLTGSISITLFPQLFMRSAALLEPEKVLVVTGKVEQQRGRDDIQIVANTVMDAGEAIKRFSGANSQGQPETLTSRATGRWYLKITAAAEAAGALDALNVVIQSHHGQNPVLAVYEATGKKLALGQQNWLTDGDDTLNALQQILGANNVVFQLD